MTTLLPEAGTATADVEPSTRPSSVPAEVLALVEADAAASEEAGTVTPRVIEALHEHNLFRALAPTCVGGAEVPAAQAYSIIEDLAYADGSTGWSYMAGATYLAVAGSLLDDSVLDQIYSVPRAVIAGQLAPPGTAEATPHGYKVQGRFGFASGSGHANWFFAGFREISDGAQVFDESGAPSILAALFPRDRVELLGNWDVIGLRGTGSVDYAVPVQEIDRAFTFPVLTAVPLRGGPLQWLGPSGLSAIGHAGWACGVSRRSLDELISIARSKRRLGRKTLLEEPVFQYQYALAEAELASSRAYFLSALADVENAAEQGEITQPLRARLRLATTNTCSAAQSVVGFAYKFGGSNALRDGSVLQRCYRDVSAGEQHVFTDHNTYRDAARALLGVDDARLNL